MRIIIICNRIIAFVDWAHMAGYLNSYGGSARRGAFGLVIIAAHVGFVALLVLGTLMKPVNEVAPPIVVSFLEQPSSEPAVPLLSDPKLATVQPVSVTVPDVPIPPEPRATDITASAEPPSLPEPMSQHIAAPEQVSVAEPPSMSEVAYLKQPAPHYPTESRRSFEEGLVILRVLIDESGHAKSVNIYRSSGHPRLDEAAREAVVRAVFKPYIDGGIARAAIAMVPVEFSLHHG
jgi:protein TonB